MKKIFKMTILSSVCTFIFVIIVCAAVSYNIGDVAITSTFNNYYGTYDYTDATAYAQYIMTDVSFGSAGYSRFYTTLERLTAGYWQGLGERTTEVPNKNLSFRVSWTDIAAGSFRYHVVGDVGTSYAIMSVGSF